MAKASNTTGDQRPEAPERDKVRLGSILAAAVDGIVTISAGGLIDAANPAASRIFGYTESQLIGEPITKLMPEEYRARHNEGLEDYLRTGRAKILGSTTEVEGQRQDGTRFPLELTIAESTSDGERFFTGILRDISERKAAQRLYVDDQLRRAVAAAPIIILRLNRSGRVAFVNRGLDGKAPEDVVGTPCDDYFSPDDGSSWRDTLQPVFEERQSLEFLSTGVSPSGVPGRFSVHAAPFPEEGRVQAAILMVTDVTEKMRLEALLLQAQKLEAVGKLAGGIAHDFNNLLTVIISFATFVRDELPSGGEAESDIVQVLEAADRAAGLTRQLLLFSRQQPATLVAMDVNQALQDLERILHRTLGEDVALKTFPSTELPTVVADTTQFDQLIVNLAVNARDAMPTGGRLSIVVDTREFDEVGRSDGLLPGRYACIRVEDTGGGMDASTLSKIFDPFFTTKGTEGTGLGLATCYGIATGIGGTIEVQSTIGVGSVFSVYLPLSDLPPDSRAALSNRPRGLAGNELVLVVEDEAAIRKVAERALRERGYRVLTAGNLAEARLAFDENVDELDALFCDVVLPDGNGFSLARHVSGRRPDLTILLTSGYMDRRLAEHEGEFPIFWKPYTPTELIRKLRACLDVTRSPTG